MLTDIHVTHGSKLLLLNVTKRHQQTNATFELHIPELVCQPGQFIAVVGESGCGKSTLLDLLALISRPSSCDMFSYYHIDVKNLWNTYSESQLAQFRRTSIGYILQTGGLLPFLTVIQNINLTLQLANKTTNTLYNLAERIGIVDTLDKKPQYLSGGQRQRVAILKALIHRPQIILADEPTAAVDENRALSIVQDFYSLAKEQNVTVIMVTHNRHLIQQVDKIYTFHLKTVSEHFTRSVCQLA